MAKPSENKGQQLFTDIKRGKTNLTMVQKELEVGCQPRNFNEIIDDVISTHTQFSRKFVLLLQWQMQILENKITVNHIPRILKQFAILRIQTCLPLSFSLTQFT